MSALWSSRKGSAIETEKASQRLDCFLSVLYLFPNCLDVQDVELLRKREDELSRIFSYAGRGFFLSYVGLSFFQMFIRKGTTPYFRQFVQHSFLCISGSFASAYLAEKIAAEMVYNQVLIDLSDKYNFSPEEVMDLQRNLNQYYVKKDREADMNRL